mmetsp:Transcript_24527/g.44475  ORF Transcript_24527/g.44475 Transcript_24527/m.44475 type:complete len:231 (+) Transcript_24527:618-1310(+)
MSCRSSSDSLACRAICCSSCHHTTSSCITSSRLFSSSCVAALTSASAFRLAMTLARAASSCLWASSAFCHSTTSACCDIRLSSYRCDPSSRVTSSRLCSSCMAAALVSASTIALCSALPLLCTRSETACSTLLVNPLSFTDSPSSTSPSGLINFVAAGAPSGPVMCAVPSASSALLLASNLCLSFSSACRAICLSSSRHACDPSSYSLTALAVQVRATLPVPKASLGTSP